MYCYLMFLMLIVAVASNPTKVSTTAQEFLAECAESNDPWYDERFCVWAVNVKWPKKIWNLPLMQCCNLRRMRVKIF